MWSTVTPNVGSPVPCSRSKLAVCIYQNYIYLLGGRTRNQQTKDFWRYNIGEHTWSELKSMGDGPARLEDHTMVSWKGKLYVFGGEVSFASTGETPLWIYDIASNSWRKKWKYYSVVQPQGCRGHTSVVYKGAMYVYGGYRDLKGSSTELWSFHFEKEMWQPVIASNGSEVPAGRHDHSSVVHDSAMWVYGGMTNLHERTDFWRWDFETKRWARLKCKGGPGELHGHTACKVFSSMLVFGGERARQPQDTLWRFHFATETWERLTLSGVLPGPRSRHSSLVVPSVLLIPTECKPSERPKSIPCQSILTRSSAPRQRPVSSPPVANDQLYDVENDNCYQPEWPHSRNVTLCDPKHTNSSDTHNQLNFRAIKERISNVSLLKPSYSAYSALSNSSDSVQDDESDEVAEMQNSANEKLRSISKSAVGLPNLQPIIKYRNQMSGETISRDLMSVPNFQQLSNYTIPAREVQTPQAGPRSNCYSLYEGFEDNWTGTSTEKLSFDRFLQYYSLVPRNEGTNGFEHAITDSEDSGIHGVNGEKKEGYWNKGLTGDDAQLILLPGMVQETPKNSGLTQSAKKTLSMYDDFSLIDLHNDNFEPIRSEKREDKETHVKMLSNNCPSQGLQSQSKNSEAHKDFVSCLNHSANVENNKKRRPSVGGLELKTFPQNQDEMIPSMMTSQPTERQPKDAVTQNGCDVKRVQLCTTTYLSNTKIGEEDEEVREFMTTKPEDQPHYFSMLVFGGREDGNHSCLNKPLTIWRCEVWR